MHQTKAEYFQVTETEYSSKLKLSPPQLLSPKCLELSNFNNSQNQNLI